MAKYSDMLDGPPACVSSLLFHMPVHVDCVAVCVALDFPDSIQNFARVIRKSRGLEQYGRGNGELSREKGSD